ncbi:unnamed protein product [Peniophora sp. CBMAI 1063]|nr:unnamed protein product [Peniophora sp. CBMAI 1063]
MTIQFEPIPHPASLGAGKRRRESFNDEDRRLKAKYSHASPYMKCLDVEDCSCSDGADDCSCVVVANRIDVMARSDNMRFVLPSSSSRLWTPLDESGVGGLMESISGGSTLARCINCGRTRWIAEQDALRIFNNHAGMLPGGLPRRAVEFGADIDLVPEQVPSPSLEAQPTTPRPPSPNQCPEPSCAPVATAVCDVEMVEEGLCIDSGSLPSHTTATTSEVYDVDMVATGSDQLDRLEDNVRASEPENLGDSYIFVRTSSMSSLLSACGKLRKIDLMQMGALHHHRLARDSRVDDMRDQLRRKHTCQATCSTIVYVFKGRISERKDETTGKVSSKQGGETKSAAVRTGSGSSPVEDNPAFPEFCTASRRKEILREFQEFMAEDNFQYGACAVCGQKKLPSALEWMPISEVPLEVLQNEEIPEDLTPKSYDFELYQRAYLCATGMRQQDVLDDIRVCSSCRGPLSHGTQPLDAIANFQYYAYERLPPAVSKAFAESTLHERQLIAGCRASKITFLYTAGATPDRKVPQGYVKGNVAILPQEVGKVSQLIPPAPDDTDYSICVVFIGGEKPSLETISKLTPVLVSRSRVELLAKFLTERNMYYTDYGLRFSKENLDAMCASEQFTGDCGVTTSVEIIHSATPSGAHRAVNADYTKRADELKPEPGIRLEDLLIDAVGFSDDTQTCTTSEPALTVAQEWCRRRRPFLGVASDTRLFPERDPRMLTYVFPHLDPWGIGGFNNPRRSAKQRISLSRQVKNLLNQYDSPFARDPNFAYICWNIVQKMENSRATQFSIKSDLYKELVEEVVRSADALEDMAQKWLKNPFAQASDPHERKLLSMLNKLKAILHDLPGSNASKLKMRNEVRGLMKTHGTPALFVTFAPSDIHSSLLYLLGGGDPKVWASLDPYERGRFVAKNPEAAARFFDIMVKGFLEKIVRFGDPRPGLFGRCTAYYGTVEAQGRGTLHLHMVLWLEGNPNPQRLRDRMNSNDQFRTRMFKWLEDIIRCELPDDERVFKGDAEKLKKPQTESAGDPRIWPVPLLREFEDSAESEAIFESNFTDAVRSLAVSCNWHEHTETCWKHLKPKQPRDSAHCRMRHTGAVREATALDPETESIMLRRLHPWINNYNDVMLYLLRCNMDIKYVGSGEAAKALSYYITDYITKPSLPTHAALAAVCTAIHKTRKQVGEIDDRQRFRRSLLTKIINGIMGKIELSYAQVMSYLVGGGDHYSSHTFRNLNWGMLDRFVRLEEQERGLFPKEAREPVEDDVGDIVDTLERAEEAEDRQLSKRVASELETTKAGEDTVEDDGEELLGDGGDEPRMSTHERGEVMNKLLSQLDEDERPNVTVKIDQKGMTASNLLLDYRLRGGSKEFEQLSVWEYVSSVECITMESEKERLKKLDAHEEAGKQKRRGRKPAKRDKFLQDHPRSKTHVCRLRIVPLTPVVLGPTLPRKGRSPAEDERWYRAMVVLFKPWRTFEDMRGGSATWREAYERCNFSLEQRIIMGNIDVESECKDAKQRYEIARRAGDVEPLLAGSDGVIKNECGTDLELLSALADDTNTNVYCLPASDSSLEGVEQDEPIALLNGTQLRIQDCIRNLERAGIALSDADIGANVDSTVTPNSGSSTFSVPSPDLAMKHEKIMAALKKNKRPNDTETSSRLPIAGTSEEFVYPTRRAKTSKMYAFNERYTYASKEELRALPLTSPVRRWSILEEVLEDAEIVGVEGREDNKEQEAAVRMICGTGKSHVINTVREFFRRCELTSKIRLSAPTGAAAILIGGHTIHALTFLPQGRGTGFKRAQELRELWRGVRYLIIDEVSMLSAGFLAQVSQRLGQALGRKDLPFGGLNIIFTGDFGQLPPVKVRSLYHHSLVETIEKNQGQTEQGQTELYGAYLWRQVRDVVCLKTNMRSASDPAYANLIGRIRVGKPNKVVTRNAAGILRRLWRSSMLL